MSARLPLDLIRKYNVPGPRYTSYPPATEFTAEFFREHLLEDLRANNATPRPLSLYFHLPFCETLCWFCGCTTVIGKDDGRTARYLEYLEREVALMAPRLHPDSRVVQMHFGGGTPNYLLPEQVQRLGACIARAFRFAEQPEISVELDPRRLTRAHVDAFRALGATRASFGVQDFNPVVQRVINRVQPMELNQQAIAWIREAGYTSVNIDLIYGLPYQTVDSFAHTVREALTLAPDRLAVFNYAHVPWLRPAQKLLEDKLPAPDERLAMLRATSEILAEHGYVNIGMDHFARAEDELAQAQRAGTLQRNFQGYSTRGGADVYGFGISSISQTETHYRQNDKNLLTYYAALDRGELPLTRACLLTREDQIRRTVIMRLMCDLRLDYGALSRALAIDFTTMFAAELAKLETPAVDGLVELRCDGLRVTEIGRLFIRNLAMVFDAHTQRGTPTERKFSRAV